MNPCVSGRHHFLDPELAQLCCSPSWRQIFVATADISTTDHLTGIRRTAEPNLWRGYVPKETS